MLFQFHGTVKGAMRAGSAVLSIDQSASLLIEHLILFFSSRRRHTICSRDWSSDVCSSDLELDTSLLHAHERRGEVEEQGRVVLAAVHGSVGVFEVVREVEGEHVDGEHAGLARAQGGERLLVRVVAVGGEDDEAFDTGFLPGSEQIVHPAVQRLAAHGGVAGEGPLGGGVDPIFDCRGAEDLERPGQVVGQALDDDGVTTKREVGAVLLARSHRYEEAGIALKNEAHLVGDEGLEVQRRAHVALAGCAAAIAAAEWLHGSAAAWAWAAGAAGGAATLPALVRMPPPRPRPSPRPVSPPPLGPSRLTRW